MARSIFYLIVFALALLATLGVIYYYMINYSTISLTDALQSTQAHLLESEKITKQSELDSKDTQIRQLKAQTSALKASQNSITNKLRYTIKPKEKIVAHCKIMKIGRYAMPQTCQQELLNGVVEMINSDNKIVAFEVSGVVDNLPYGGLSPELKQEGLASFRARAAITNISKKISSVAVFEGLSKQRARERGFIVRAFYVENSH